MSNFRQDARRGGNNRIISENVGTCSAGDPEHNRDISLLSQSVDKLRRQMAAHRINGQHICHSTQGLHKVLRNVLFDLSTRPFSHASDKIRALCMVVLGLKALPPLPEAEVPDVLRNLPKKPPQRKPSEDE